MPAKLTYAQIEELVKTYYEGKATMKTLAKKYNVSDWYIRDLIANQTNAKGEFTGPSKKPKIPTDQKEIWRLADLPSKNEYYVSNFGRIKSMAFEKETILSGKYANGHHCIDIFNTELGRRQNVSIARLVADAFLNKPKEWDETWKVAKKDFNKMNNHVSNLFWATASTINRRTQEQSPNVKKYKKVLKTQQDNNNNFNANAKFDWRTIATMKHLVRLGVSKDIIMEAFEISRTHLRKVLS